MTANTTIKLMKVISTICLALLPLLLLISGLGFAFLIGLLASFLVYALIDNDLVVAIYTGYLIAIMFFGIVLYL